MKKISQRPRRRNLKLMQMRLKNRIQLLNNLKKMKIIVSQKKRNLKMAKKPNQKILPHKKIAKQKMETINFLLLNLRKGNHKNRKIY